MATLFYLCLGTFFGWVLSRSGAADYGFIQRMFQFQDFQLFGIFAGALAVTLLVNASLFVRSYSRIGNIDPGFDPSHLLTMRLTMRNVQRGSASVMRFNSFRITDAVSATEVAPAALQS